MRKPRDFDAEMKVLDDRARQLRERKVQQLGELVIACRADGLPIDVLVGAMLVAADMKDTATIEGWRKRGAAFFQSAPRSAARRNRSDARGAPAGDGGAQPAPGDAGAQ
jgi:hypothetical protein